MVETRNLTTQLRTTTHHGLSPPEWSQLGITDGMARLSVGLEAVEDLNADLEQTLQ